MSDTTKRRHGPQRPWKPNSKGLAGAPVLQLPCPLLPELKSRAAYETLHYRIEHKGRGPVISPGDIVRRLIEKYFKEVSALPDDAIGAMLRKTK